MSSSFNYFSAFTFVILLLFIISPASCHPPSNPSSGLSSSSIDEEKTRLGSRPPSCHNKCNQCHPCMAVQVPTIPVHHHRVQPFDESSPTGNYKPLGWKCHCDNHFYNP